MTLDRSTLLFGMLRSLVSTIFVRGPSKEASHTPIWDGSISLQRAVNGRHQSKGEETAMGLTDELDQTLAIQ